jgi:hypothetical protein
MLFYNSIILSQLNRPGFSGPAFRGQVQKPRLFLPFNNLHVIVHAV